MVSSMINPPQGGEYRPLPGALMPETFPFDYSEMFNYGYFLNKYYLTHRNLLAFAKRPTYVNFEVLTAVLNTNVVDFSNAEIY